MDNKTRVFLAVSLGSKGHGKLLIKTRDYQKCSKLKVSCKRHEFGPQDTLRYFPGCSREPGQRETSCWGVRGRQKKMRRNQEEAIEQFALRVK